MQVYEHRLESFANAELPWPHNTNEYLATPETLAKAGFFFNPQQLSLDAVQCFLCQKSLDGWEPSDDPFEEHRSHTTDCPWATVVCESQQVCPMSREVIQRVDLEVKYLGGKTNQALTARLETARMATYRDWWPHEHKKGWSVHVKKMAKAGYYYSPSSESDDAASCPYCNLSMDFWEPKDDPKKEHKKRSPWCLFFQRVRNKNSSVGSVGMVVEPNSTMVEDTGADPSHSSQPVTVTKTTRSSIVVQEDDKADLSDQETDQASITSRSTEPATNTLRSRASSAASNAGAVVTETGNKARKRATSSASTGPATTTTTAPRRSKRERSPSISQGLQDDSPHSKDRRLEDGTDPADLPPIPTTGPIEEDSSVSIYTSDPIKVDTKSTRRRGARSKLVRTTSAESNHSSHREDLEAMEVETGPVRPDRLKPPLPPAEKTKGATAGKRRLQRAVAAAVMAPPAVSAGDDDTIMETSLAVDDNTKMTEVVSPPLAPKRRSTRKASQASGIMEAEVTNEPANLPKLESKVATSNAVVVTDTDTDAVVDRPMPEDPVAVEEIAQAIKQTRHGRQTRSTRSSAATVAPVAHTPVVGPLSLPSPPQVSADSSEYPASPVSAPVEEKEDDDEDDEKEKEVPYVEAVEAEVPSKSEMSMDSPVPEATNIPEDPSSETPSSPVPLPVEPRVPSPASSSHSSPAAAPLEESTEAAMNSTDISPVPTPPRSPLPPSLAQQSTASLEDTNQIDEMDVPLPTLDAPLNLPTIAAVDLPSPKHITQRHSPEVAPRPPKATLLLRDPTQLLEIITPEEADMTVEEFIRFTIQQECDRLHHQCETLVHSFISEAEKVRTRIQHM